jgi:glycyl-tRNA synthetase beta chain
MMGRGDFSHAQSMIFKIQPVLNVFFEKILVMAEEKKLRQNRLGLLQAIHKMLAGIADYSQIVVEGERPSVPGPSR